MFYEEWSTQGGSLLSGLEPSKGALEFTPLLGTLGVDTFEIISFRVFKTRFPLCNETILWQK